VFTRFLVIGALAAGALRPQSALAQRRGADTVVSVDTVRLTPVVTRGRLERASGGLFERLRPADAIGLFELGVFGQAVSSARLGGNNGLGGGVRGAVVLPYGLQLEADASIARRPRDDRPPQVTGVTGLDTRRFDTYSARLLSNWDFGNRSTMFFGGGFAVNDRSGFRDQTGPSGIIGYRIGEEVALRGDVTVLYVARDRWTDVGFRLGISVAAGTLRGSPRVRRGRSAQPSFAVERTVLVTQRDTVYRTDTVFLAAPERSGRSSSGDVALPPAIRPETSSVVVRFSSNQAMLSADAKRDLVRWLATWGNRVADDPSVRVIVSGFADQCGPAMVNERVSFERARATRQYLVDSLRVPAERVLTRALGERRIMEARETAGACNSAIDRRAEVRAEAVAGALPPAEDRR
jgi:outer membrane protein OmpA-like peptidoglycan-associated protein